MQDLHTHEELLPGTVSTTCAGSFLTERRFYRYTASKTSLLMLQSKQVRD